jgi:hypothetical protein
MWGMSPGVVVARLIPEHIRPYFDVRGDWMPRVGNLAFGGAKAQDELCRRPTQGRKHMTMYALQRLIVCCFSQASKTIASTCKDSRQM